MKVTLTKQTPISIQEKFLGIILCIMYAYLQFLFKKQGIKNCIIRILKKVYSSEISPTRCNICVFILCNGFTLHVSGDNLTHHQEYICCIWPQLSQLT